MAYLDKSAQWSIVKETTYADGTAIPTDGSKVVELINPTMDASTELIQREVIRNSLVQAQPVLGKETSSGSMSVEFSSVDTGTINGDLLFESGMGVRIAPVVSEGVSIAAGVATVAATSAYKVGQAVKLTGGAGGTQFAVIRQLNTGTTMTLAPTPATDHTNIEGLLSYTIARPDTAAISMAVEEYFENATNAITYKYDGVVVTDMTINFPVANIVKADFSLAGAGFTVASGVANRASVCHNVTPYVAKNMTFTYAGTSYDVSDLSCQVASDVYDVEALTTDGITNKVVTGKSTVGGSFMLEYEGTALFNAFQAGTSGELFGTVANASSTAGIYAPKVIISNSSKSVDSSIYKDSADFTCLSSDICTDTAEDALTIFFS